MDYKDDVLATLSETEAETPDVKDDAEDVEVEDEELDLELDDDEDEDDLDDEEDDDDEVDDEDDDSEDDDEDATDDELGDDLDGEVDSEKKITMSQKQFDKAIQKRLAQQERKFEARIKELESGKSDLTPEQKFVQKMAEKANMNPAEFMETVRKSSRLRELEGEAERLGVSAEYLYEKELAAERLQELEEENLRLKGQDPETRLKGEQKQNEIKEFKERFPNVDASVLGRDEKFNKFYKSSNLSLAQAYELFVEVVGEVRTKERSKAKSRKDRSLGSGAGKSPKSKSHGLTQDQKQLAKDAGMTYKEFADGLKKYKHSISN